MIFFVALAEEGTTLEDLVLQQRAQAERSLREIQQKHLQLRRGSIQPTRNCARFRRAQLDISQKGNNIAINLKLKHRL